MINNIYTEVTMEDQYARVRAKSTEAARRRFKHWLKSYPSIILAKWEGTASVNLTCSVHTNWSRKTNVAALKRGNNHPCVHCRDVDTKVKA